MGAIKGKSKSKKTSSKSSIGGKIKKVLTGKSGTTTRKHRGVAYYQNAVLKEKLKKKLNRLKYGGR